MKRTTFISSVLLSATLFLGSNGALAQNPNLGTSGAQFLQIPVGPRAAAMGGATVAVLNDASALFWNPAGIARVTGGELFVAHTPWWASIKLNNAALVYSFQDWGTFGVSMTLLTMDKMEVTTELQPEGTNQFFDAQDLMVGVSFARRLTEDFSAGVTVKYVSQRIWNESAGGVAFDVGTQYRIGLGDLTLGMSMTNFGSDLSYEGRDLSVKYDSNPQNINERLIPARLYAEDFPLPLHFQVGLAMTVVKTNEFSLLLATDVTHPNDNKERVNVGAEVLVLDRLALRGGYKFGYDTESATFGAGVHIPLGGTNLTFDYAYAIYDLLPNINRLSIELTF